MSDRVSGRETLVHDGWMRVWRVTLDAADGTPIERYVEDHGAAVAVLLYDPVRRVARLVTQPRPPVLRAGEPMVLEAVAGSLEPGGPEHTARAEALEEAGVAVADLEAVTLLWTMPSVSSERVHLYLAAYDATAIVGPGGGADGEHEDITVHEVPLAELAMLAQSGRLTDAKTLVLVLSLMLRRPELFVA